MKMKFIAAGVAVVATIATARAQFTDFVCTDYSQGKIFVFEQGRIVWEHEAPVSNDLWVLPGGNLLFCTGKGVLEVTRNNDTVFHYSSTSNIFACQRLSGGNTFVGECESGMMLEINPRGEIVRRVCVLPEGVTDGGYHFMRNARRLDNGHYLVAHYRGQRVAEYDETGREIWSVATPGGAHSVVRRPDGNTLVAVADMTKNPRVVEFDPSGRIVWEVTNADLPGAPLAFAGGMYCLSDGDILVSNWIGHGNAGEKPHVLLIGRDKTLKAVFGSIEGIRTISSIYSLEDPREKQAFTQGYGGFH